MSKSNANEWLKEVVELSLLYDFYGELLSESSKIVFEGYVLNDMSLAEIAEETGISRQGIHDTIKRTEKKLYQFEEKLHLVEKFEAVKDNISHIKNIAEDIKNNSNKSIENVLLDELIDVAQDMLDSY